uniref:Uncharacterized protein n=1 Tax=Arundo donax TaxID=35708 RepID=A0A0A8YNE6_ARUDO
MGYISNSISGDLLTRPSDETATHAFYFWGSCFELPVLDLPQLLVVYLPNLNCCGTV